MLWGGASISDVSRKAHSLLLFNRLVGDTILARAKDVAQPEKPALPNNTLHQVETVSHGSSFLWYGFVCEPGWHFAVGAVQLAQHWGRQPPSLTSISQDGADRRFVKSNFQIG